MWKQFKEFQHNLKSGIADINKVSDLIVDRKIKAIYTESSVPKKTIESLQAAVKDRGFDVSIGGEIYSDSLKEDAKLYRNV
ncbi:zinc ABC transporter substrate-binding protein [Erysipelothrix sp. Poltava]|nr:zinc ABC transporter substrate-binding protein [Erysipelothrix sp. Poltava]